MSRLTIEAVRERAWQKGWEFFASVRRGARYSARPAHWAIFAREEPSWGFFDLAQANRFFDTVVEPIACRVDYGAIRWRKAQRLREVAA